MKNQGHFDQRAVDYNHPNPEDGKYAPGFGTVPDEDYETAIAPDREIELNVKGDLTSINDINGEEIECLISEWKGRSYALPVGNMDIYVQYAGQWQKIKETTDHSALWEGF